MVRIIPNYFKLRDVCSTGESRKPLSSFIAGNVEKDEDGSFRIPTAFLEKFGETLYYHLYIKNDNIMWHAIYDKDRKKISGLYDFLRFYDLRMYSVVVFDYFGCGDFSVKCYKPTATSVISPTIEPVEFFANENSIQLRMDEFIYGRNYLEVEKYIGFASYNAVKHNPDEFKIEVTVRENREERKTLKLQANLEDLYKNWKGMDKIFLSLGKRMWKIEVLWDNGSCIFGNGWYNLLKQLDIYTGDVIAMTIGETPGLVFFCIIKKEELIAEKEEGETNGKRSFYKILQDTTFEHGYVVLPILIGAETEKTLSAIEKIQIYGQEWQIRYNERYRIIYGLDRVIKHFNVELFDSIHFSFGEYGVLCGRIFKRDGIEIIYSNPGTNASIETWDDCFLFEESYKDSKLDMGVPKLMNVVYEAEVPINDVNMPNVIENVISDVIEDLVTDEQENVGAVIQNVEDAMVYQFSNKLIACNMNNRCHGMHIPANILFRNREWRRGDVVTFRTTRGTWNIRIVLNNGKARFSGGWSKFVKDHELKKHDNLCFTLREEADNPVFDIEVNPRN